MKPTIDHMSPEYLENLTAGGKMFHLHWREITPNPLNELVRGGQANAEMSLAELSASIKAHGVIQPLLVQKSSHGWMILTGERRWRATKALGEDAPLLPCVIRHTDGELDSLVQMGIENIQRQNLDPITEARYYAALIERGLDKAGICREVGVNMSALNSRLALLELAPAVQAHIQAGRIPSTAAKHLGQLDQPAQSALAHKMQGRPVAAIAQAVSLIKKRQAAANSLPDSGRAGEGPGEGTLTDAQKLAELRRLAAALVAQLRLDAQLLHQAATDLADIDHPGADQYFHRATHIETAIKGVIKQ